MEKNKSIQTEKLHQALKPLMPFDRFWLQSNSMVRASLASRIQKKYKTGELQKFPGYLVSGYLTEEE